MTNLMRASNELFKRSPDEVYESLQSLYEYCREQNNAGLDRWHPPSSICVNGDDNLLCNLGNDGAFLMNDWSFSQLCRMAGVAKDTVNRLTPRTASSVFGETLSASGTKPLQFLTVGNRIRSIHGTQYTRLWNADLIQTLKEFAVDFHPPQKGMNGATGLYAGEQDMFAFLIDPLGWTEIGDQNYAPGFFVWNSEVGRRALGIQTFWFQAVCQNHIVWDATEVIEWTRKHTSKVGDGLTEICRIIEGLVQKRDERKDGFAATIKKAMEATLGDDAEKVLAFLNKNGINRSLAQEAYDIAQKKGRFTIWTIVDALTQLSQASKFAGDRIEADQKASQLLQLV
jgi:hypothetical protein